MGVSMNPMSISKKKFHPQVCVGPYSVFELGWDLSDTSCPGNLASWLAAGPFAVKVLAGSTSTFFSLQGSFEGGCSGVGVLSLGLPSVNGGSPAAPLLVVCAALGLCTEVTALVGGEVLPDGGASSLWLLGLRCSLVLW